MNKGSDADELQRFYREIDALNLAPLWESLHDLVTPEPVTPARLILRCVSRTYQG